MNDARDIQIVQDVVENLKVVVPGMLRRNGLDALGPEVQGYVNENGIGPAA